MGEENKLGEEIIDPYDFCNVPEADLLRSRNAETVDGYSGIDNDFSYETKTRYDRANSEYLIDSPVNAFILIGRDRNSGTSSGTGGIGHTGNSCIDIVAGHFGPKPIQKVKLSGSSEPEEIFLGKNFKLDSSRLYLTQKAVSIDKYLELPSMQIPMGSKNFKLENDIGTAAAALISDQVRVVARENIKLITFHGCSNSLGKNNVNSGIAIIAGANKCGSPDIRYQPQPMVKGNNLLMALNYIVSMIVSTRARVSSILNRQMIINNLLATHVHQSGYAGMPTLHPIASPISQQNLLFSIQSIPEIIKSELDPAVLEGTYFNINHPSCILSEFNVNN